MFTIIRLVFRRALDSSRKHVMVPMNMVLTVLHYVFSMMIQMRNINAMITTFPPRVTHYHSAPLTSIPIPCFSVKLYDSITNIGC
jgi:hypothetical protein